MFSKPITFLLVSIVASMVVLDTPVYAAGLKEENSSGFDENNVFSSPVTGVDQVNLFTGALQLALPVGPKYSLAGGLDYQLELVHESNVWDSVIVCTSGAHIGFPDNTVVFAEHNTNEGTLSPPSFSYYRGSRWHVNTDGNCFTEKQPYDYFNVGVGWRVSFGELYEPVQVAIANQGRSWRLNDSNHWVFVDASGTSHKFYKNIVMGHDGDCDSQQDPNGSNCASVRDFYTRDGSYYHLKLTNDGHPGYIEGPDGKRYSFARVHRETGNADYSVWQVSRVEKKLGENSYSFINIDYQDNVWTITDSIQRTHRLQFSVKPGVDDPVLRNVPMLDSVQLNLNDNGATSPHTLTYTLDYRNPLSTARECPALPGVTRLPYLSKLNQPDGTGYQMWFHTEASNSECADGPSGRLAGIVLPTGAKYEYEYGDQTDPGSLGGWYYSTNFAVGSHSVPDQPTRPKVPGVPNEPVRPWGYILNNQRGVSERHFCKPVGDVQNPVSWECDTWTYEAGLADSYAFFNQQIILDNSPEWLRRLYLSFEKLVDNPRFHSGSGPCAQSTALWYLNIDCWEKTAFTRVTRPDNKYTIHYFNLYSGSTDSVNAGSAIAGQFSEMNAAAAGREPWLPSDYGLPFTRYKWATAALFNGNGHGIKYPDPNGSGSRINYPFPIYLSSETYDDSHSLLSQTYLRYDDDLCQTAESNPQQNSLNCVQSSNGIKSTDFEQGAYKDTNRRVRYERTYTFYSCSQANNGCGVDYETSGRLVEQPTSRNNNSSLNTQRAGWDQLGSFTYSRKGGSGFSEEGMGYRESDTNYDEPGKITITGGRPYFDGRENLNPDDRWVIGASRSSTTESRQEFRSVSATGWGNDISQQRSGVCQDELGRPIVSWRENSGGHGSRATHYSYNNFGHPVDIRIFGGDDHALPAVNNLCNGQHLTDAQYRKTLSYYDAIGVLRTSYAVDPVSGQQLQLLLNNVSIDYLGNVTEARKTDGTGTSTNYDLLGRAVESHPVGVGTEGQAATVEYTYCLGVQTHSQSGVFLPALRDCSEGNTGYNHVSVKTYKGSEQFQRQRHHYDTSGRLVETKAELSDGNSVFDQSQKTQFDSIGRVHKVTTSRIDPDLSLSAHTFTHYYDKWDRQQKIVQPDESIQVHCYDGGNTRKYTLTFDKDSLGPGDNPCTASGYVTHQSVEFDVFGRQVRVTDDFGDGIAPTVNYYRYDIRDQITRVFATGVDSQGNHSTQQRTFNYDELGLLRSARHAEIEGEEHFLRYDAMGNLQHYQLRDTAGSIVRDLQHTFDKLGRPIRTAEKVAGIYRPVTEYFYAYRNQHGSLSAGKMVQARRYNYLDDVEDSRYIVTEQMEYAGGVGGENFGWVSNKSISLAVMRGGQLAVAASAFGDNQFGYDALGRLVYEIYPDVLAGMDGQQGVAPGRQVNYFYQRGQLVRVSDIADQTTTHAARLFYHENGSQARINYGNGLYDVFGVDAQRLPRVGSINLAAGGSPGVNWDLGTYTYNGAGSISQIGNDSFTYDLNQRLTQATLHGRGGALYQADFSYDGFGNLTERRLSGARQDSFENQISPVNNNRITAYCYLAGNGGGNACNTALPMSIDYDVFGNVTGMSLGHQQSIALDYDVFNRPVRRVGNQGDSHRYYYDANNNRTIVDHNGLLDGITLTWRGMHQRILREWTISLGSNGWNWNKDYIYSGGQVVAAATAEGDGALNRYYHSDHLGSTRVTSDENGDLVNRLLYYPFGEVAYQHSDEDERHLFTGHERDRFSSSGQDNRLDDLDYMLARYYSPVTGRFLSVDPVLGEPGSTQRWNRYSYALNNPVNLIDLDGLNPVVNTLRHPVIRPAVMKMFNQYVESDAFRTIAGLYLSSTGAFGLGSDIAVDVAVDELVTALQQDSNKILNDILDGLDVVEGATTLSLTFVSQAVVAGVVKAGLLEGAAMSASGASAGLVGGTFYASYSATGGLMRILERHGVDTPISLYRRGEGFPLLITPFGNIEIPPEAFDAVAETVDAFQESASTYTERQYEKAKTNTWTRGDFQ